MRRLLLRVLSVMRWPSAVLATIMLVWTLLSPFTYTSIEVISPTRKAFIRAATSSGSVEVSVYVSLGDQLDRLTALLSLDVIWLPDGPRFSGWWDWGYQLDFSQGFQVDRISLPLWCIFVPLGALSALGFRARRRLVIPAGACANCHHPLAGASVCPECGAAAASSGVSAHQS